MSLTREQLDAKDTAAPLECDREPIHIPGSIQPHGVLAVLGPNGTIVQISENSSALFSLDEPPLGKTLAELVGREAKEIEASLARLPLEGRPQYVKCVGVGEMGRAFHLIAHRHEGALILEFEPDGESEGALGRAFPIASAFLTRLEMASEFEDLTHITATEIRNLTGFDRVLIYRFDEDGAGTVVAEDRNDKFPAYLGHRFPASDIPRQARELYLKSRIRLIVNAQYRPAALVPALRPDTDTPLDLTFAGLRSVSPVHVEYMRNMGTAASMSISLLVAGQLWGLISCHHHAPRPTPFLIRSACDYMGQALALQIASAERGRELRRTIEMKSIQSQLLASMAAEKDYCSGLLQASEKLLEFANAAGAAIIRGERCDLIGTTPTEAQIRDLIGWLDDVGDEVHATANLSADFPPARAYRDVASGVLGIKISKLHGDYVLWFRPEMARTVSWAGDPRKPTGGNGDRLHPRRSFELWQETVRETSTPWRPSEIAAAVELRNLIIGIVLRKAEEMAELNEELVRSNRELEAFSYSVSHDLRAPFRHIVGYAELLRDRAAARLESEERRYLNVITESAHTAGLLVDSLLSYSRMGRARLEMAKVDLGEIIMSAREMLDAETAGRSIEWRIGTLPHVMCDPTMMRLAITNLLGNAVKFTRGRDPAVIEVSATSDPDAVKHVHGDVRAAAECGQVVLCVRDNGVGFDMRYVHKLFGVFQRLHRAEEFEGTGIGLANVRRIAVRHGGWAWAEGILGEGAAFFISIPSSPAPQKALRLEAGQESPPDATGRREEPC